ncbi:hypothetical protein HMPREF0765_4660 [Sphingobacterium spiritivorum ATCC 33300]|uniref:LPXTG-motif cell wall anchor domain protein n=3 Tax=Sphingobacterium spiritivorum TaxID=258 RepID=D7VK94_SPHSI|nr:hypothetical protein HMPREF0765_4660 [Sphingobacterium spiritivorum ATCC 33300]EFK58696.1 hypothetical protein HMPREF0766_11413 [Sphingobacterium spiritivorum ATCC 33861]SUI99824.1 Uncharacterised protein [Sphingobacterium spiritivorum]SUJ03183.1 Uncharacterised protein [Sphingobacterium spiritivorum]
MRAWLLILMMGIANFVFAQHETDRQDHSTLGYLVIGLILIAVVVFTLYNKQKRRFND